MSTLFAFRDHGSDFRMEAVFIRSLREMMTISIPGFGLILAGETDERGVGW